TIVLTTISIEQRYFLRSMAESAIDVNLCDVTFCTTVDMRSTIDCSSTFSSLSGSYLTKNICWQGRAPDDVSINIKFG
ncbi:unnamed protein product, partial [Rotaria sordida]